MFFIGQGPGQVTTFIFSIDLPRARLFFKLSISGLFFFISSFRQFPSIKQVNLKKFFLFYVILVFDFLEKYSKILSFLKIALKIIFKMFNFQDLFLRQQQAFFGQVQLQLTSFLVLVTPFFQSCFKSIYCGQGGESGGCGAAVQDCLG